MDVLSVTLRISVVLLIIVWFESPGACSVSVNWKPFVLSTIDQLGLFAASSVVHVLVTPLRVLLFPEVVEGAILFPVFFILVPVTEYW